MDIIVNKHCIKVGLSLTKMKILIILTLIMYWCLAIGQEEIIKIDPSAKPSSYVNNLNNLLMAEIAATRKNLESAAKNYLQVAVDTQNLEYAKIATQYAMQLNTEELAIKAVELWTKLEPQNSSPFLIHSMLYLGANPNKAKPTLLKALQLEPQQTTKQLLLVYSELSDTTKYNLYTILKELSSTNKNLDILTLTAELALAQNDSVLTEKLLTDVLNTQPDFTWGIKVKAKLIYHLHQKDDKSLEYLYAQLQKYSKNDELRMFYVQALLDKQDFKKAIPELMLLAKNNDYLNIANLYLGEINLMNNKINEAEKYLLKTDDPVAKFYLGNIAENKNDFNSAINYYTQITYGEYYMPALTNAVHLIIATQNYHLAETLLQQANPLTLEEQKQVILLQSEVYLAQTNYNNAIELLNTALQILPKDVDFLYMHSIIAKKMKNLKLSETDLQTIISVEPNNTLALNALGFIIADDPKRHNEALQYIHQALRISPQNPMFLDSLGWVFYKMGNTTEAIKVLKEAHTLNNDPNIAIHLGEVLWVIGQKKEAQQIWQKITKNTPEYVDLLETVQRLNANL